MEPEQPANERLGTAWEIAIVVVMVTLAAAILAATVFQIRRRRRQKQRRALETDVENVENAKTPRRTPRAQEKKRRTGSVNTLDEIVETHSHPVTVRDDRTIEEIQKPSPSLQLKRNNDSSYKEYLSKNPPNYYWEERFH